MNPDQLSEIGEHFLAGHVRCPSKSPMLKYAWGLREAFENAALSIHSDHNVAPFNSYYNGMCWTPCFNGLIEGRARRETKKAEYSHLPIDELLTEALQYWQDYDVNNLIRSSLDERSRPIFEINGIEKYQFYFSPWQGHATLDYRTIMHVGLPDYQKRIHRKMECLSTDSDSKKREFYEAIRIVVDAIIALATRNMTESGGCDRIRSAFRQILAGPPQNFFEAVQLLHFMNAVDGFDNVGRMDQYLYPFYQQDIEAGVLTRDEAVDLLADVFDIWGRVRLWQIVLGGQDASGKDASNPLTLVIMDARRRVKRPNPSLSLRLTSRTTDDVLAKGFELIGEGVGHPALYNDALYVDTLERMGVPRHDAVEFTFGGCTETHIAGKSAIRDSFLNLTKALEGVFYDGRVSADGPVLGARTGDPCSFSDFNEFMKAYRQQVEFIIDTFVHCRNRTQQIVARMQPALVRSIFVDGCIEEGVSNSAGGATYNYGLGDIYGIPNVGNALFAVKTLVYDRQSVTMSELIRALSDNFDGHDTLRRECLELPKYGNDCAEVDEVVRSVSEHVFSYLSGHKLWNGDAYYGFCASAPGFHVMFGKTTGATPDGRLAGASLADSMGPLQGTDRNGPTAMLNSVNKVHLSQIIGTPVVNISFRKELFVTNHFKRLAGLVRTFFKHGGMQLQFTVTDKDTLADAMRNPAEHKDLMIRVSGYCARFIDLTPELQTEIMERTLH